MAPRRKAIGATVIPAKATNITNRRTSTTIKNSRATNKRNTTHTIDYAHLQITDVLCPLCRNILIEPITLPCQHCLCWRCLQGRIMQQEEGGGTETCPQCRARFGSWYRTAKKQRKRLTNQPLWNAIREMFLKSDNPLHSYSFLTNGLRRKLPETTTAANKIANSRQEMPDGNDSNDSSCADDSIRRECNHFKPIDIHRGQVSQSVGSIRIPNIIRLPAIRSILCTNGNNIVAPNGKNSFISDRGLSAFCLAADCNQVSRIRVQIQSASIVEQVKSVAESETVFDTILDLARNSAKCYSKKRAHIKAQKYCQTGNELPTTNPTAHQRKMAQNGVSRSKHKNALRCAATKIKNNKRNYRVRQKGAQPQRQSARIVAAAAAKACVNNNGQWKGKHQQLARLQQQLQADQLLARQLHRILNSGATRRTTKAAPPICTGGRSAAILDKASVVLRLRPTLTVSRVK